MRLEIETGPDRIDVRDEGTTLVRYRPGVDAAKAFIDVLALPDGAATASGRNLVVDAPHDHPWHHGLFFCQKLIDGINCWETERHESEGRLHGRQTVGEWNAYPTDRGVAIEQDSEWHTTGGDRLLEDERRIEVHEPTEGSYVIDWRQTLIAVEETRYLTSESLHGRYGGLCVRGSRELTGASIRLPDEADPDPNADSPGCWCDLSGPLDGAHRVDTNHEGGITVMYHPDTDAESRHWFTRSDPFALLTANPVWDDVIEVPADDRIEWRWGIRIHEGIPDREELSAVYESYTRNAAD